MSRKKVIQPIDQNDVVVKKGNDKVSIVRSMSINDTTQDLKVDRTMYHKKGTFNISLTWNMNAITGDDVTDSATLQSLMQMVMLQRDNCIKWRDEWKQENTDPNQTNMFDGDGEIGGDFEDED